MIIKKVIPFAHHLLRSAISSGDVAVDATVGNGNDTEVLAELVGENGVVYGFDIQEMAIENTTNRLKERNLFNHVLLNHKSHSDIGKVINEKHVGEIAGAIFNLGYLPGGNKEIVTVPETTLNAITQLLTLMKKEGIIVLVVYHGHDEGKVERDALLNFVNGLDQKIAYVLKYEFMNQKNNPPFIIAIEKR